MPLAGPLTRLLSAMISIMSHGRSSSFFSFEHELSYLSVGCGVFYISVYLTHVSVLLDPFNPTSRYSMLRGQSNSSKSLNLPSIIRIALLRLLLTTVSPLVIP